MPDRGLRTELRSLSLAEWEYAHRFRDSLTLGELAPSREGFDAEQLHAIERTIRDAFYARRTAWLNRVRVRVG